MDFTGYYLKIAELISLEITGELTKIQKEELSKWLSSATENKQLYKKIRNELSNRIQDNKNVNIQKDIAWNKIISETALFNKPSNYRYLLKYAAILLLAVAFSGVIYLNVFKVKAPVVAVNYSLDSELEPGRQRALLVMSDGSNVELGKIKTDSIREKNGSFIENEKNILTYIDSGKSKKSKIKQEKIIYNTLITPKGGEYLLVLSDGTKVWVNADSKLIYPVKFGNESRELTLEGEAYFEVVKNPHKPFFIKTNDYTVEVLGTSFNVSAYTNDDQVMTTLVEGCVKVKDFDNSGNEVQIKPNEQLIMNKIEKGILIRKVDAQDYIAWKDGRFIFEKHDLENIMEILSRWYNFNVQFENENLKKLIFTGNMDKYEQLSMPLEMIAKTNKVNFKIEDNNVLVTTKK